MKQELRRVCGDEVYKELAAYCQTPAARPLATPTRAADRALTRTSPGATSTALAQLGAIQSSPLR